MPTYGQFDFRATPLAPPGTRVIAHINPSNRKTWELNGEAGWYVGPAMEHYRCVTCYFPRTRTTRICETVTFLPHEVPFPKVNLQDHLTQAAEDIITILTQPPNSTTPSLREGDPICNALLDISQHLKRVENIPEPTAAVQQSKNQTDATIQLPQNRAPPPRVDATKQSAPDTTGDAPPPRVEEPMPTPVSVLQEHSKRPKNARFKNTPKHDYSLRSQQ